MRYKFYKTVLGFFTFLAMLLVYTLLGFIFYKGFETINLELIFSDTAVLDAILLKKEYLMGFSLQ